MQAVFHKALKRVNSVSEKEYKDSELKDAATSANKRNLVMTATEMQLEGDPNIKRISGKRL